MLICYSKEEEKILPKLKETTEKLLKENQEKNKKELQTGEIIKIKNTNIKNPGMILWVDNNTFSKHKYLVAKVKELEAHWYSKEELEIIEDEKIIQEVKNWYHYNEENIVRRNKELLYV